MGGLWPYRFMTDGLLGIALISALGVIEFTFYSELPAYYERIIN